MIVGIVAVEEDAIAHGQRVVSIFVPKGTGAFIYEEEEIGRQTRALAAVGLLRCESADLL